jgi:hypothetical protein
MFDSCRVKRSEFKKMYSSPMSRENQKKTAYRKNFLAIRKSVLMKPQSSPVSIMRICVCVGCRLPVVWSSANTVDHYENGRLLVTMTLPCVALGNDVARAGNLISTGNSGFFFSFIELAFRSEQKGSQR